MRYFKWAVWAFAVIFVAALLHYNLPQHDIVRISDSYEKRIDFGSNAIFYAGGPRDEAGDMANRDVFFIQTTRPDGKVSVYRNEDTGWGWPFYFKFNSANLQAIATDLKSTADAPKWVAIRHYGWRNQMFSIYPNATAIFEVSGPEDAPWPWRPVVIILALLAVSRAIYVRLRRFWKTRIAPRFGRG